MVTGRIRQFEEQDGHWLFLFAPETDHTFQWMLQAFKYAIPLEERIWEDSMKRWRVRATDANAARLQRLFPNFAQEVQNLRNQLQLF